jgi:GT2 family glycosyltransferase
VVNRQTARDGVRLGTTSEAIVIEPGRNLGFAAGVNAALALARGEWIMLVNDDCVVDRGAAAALLAAGQTAADVGSVAAQVRFADRPGTINSTGIQVDVLGVAAERLLGSRVSESEIELTEVFGASGTAGLYRRELLDDLGGFDESFFAYLEDADVAWRARMAGWRCLYAPEAIVYHRHSSSLGHGSPAKHFLVGRNRVRLIAKNATTAQLARYAAHIAAYDLAYVVFAAVQAKSIAPFTGRLAGLRHWRGDRLKSSRQPVELAAPFGLRRARDRDRIYSGR